MKLSPCIELYLLDEQQLTGASDQSGIDDRLVGCKASNGSVDAQEIGSRTSSTGGLFLKAIGEYLRKNKRHLRCFPIQAVDKLSVEIQMYQITDLQLLPLVSNLSCQSSHHLIAIFVY